MPAALAVSDAALTLARRESLAAHHEAFRRQARSRFDRHERRMQPAIAEALGAWLDIVRPVALGALTLTAAGQPARKPRTRNAVVEAVAPAFTLADAEASVSRVLKMRDRFGALLDRHVMPVYAAMLDEVLGRAIADPLIGTDMLEWRGAWLAARRQQLVNIPDSVAGIYRTAITSMARREGTTVDQAESLAQTVLDRGYASWAGRARMIARTEVVGANNQGSLAAWKNLASASGQPASKTWLATEDARTRPWHASMDGETVSIHGDFSNGMNGPGDESGDAADVINCRCTLTYAFDDPEAAPDTDGLTAAGPDDAPAQARPIESDGQEPTGVAIMLVCSADEQARLAPAGMAADWPGAHCTLGYLEAQADAVTPDALAALADGLAGYTAGGDTFEVQADAFATAHFNPDSDERDPCAVLLVQSDELATLKDGVDQACEAAGLPLSSAFPIWVPHVAIAYGVSPDDVAGTDNLGPLKFDALVIGAGGQHVVVAGNPPAEPDPAGQTEPEAESLTAAEEAVTAPAPTDAPPAAPPAPPAPEPNNAPEATGGDTGAIDLTPQGPTWSGPLAMLGVPSSDGRIISATGGIIRTLPLPLSWQRESSEYGHDDSVIVGRCLQVEVRGDQLWGTGDYLDPMLNFDSQQAMAQVEAGLGLVSVDLAILEMGFADGEGNPIDPALVDPDTPVNMVALGWEFGGVTIVGFPAFEGARIINDPVDPTAAPVLEVPGMPDAFAAATPEVATINDAGDTITLTDGTDVQVGDRVGIPDYDADGDNEQGEITGIDAVAGTVTVQPDQDADDATMPEPQTFPVDQLRPAGTPDPSEAADGPDALTASSELRPYNAAFFRRDEPDEPTPLTYVPETGEVYGHLATYNECHTGKLAETGQCVTAPHSLRDYADFHLGTVFTDEGPLDVGKVTVATGHAPARGSFASTVAHYDNSGTATAVVRAKDGDYGVWVCGQAIHDTPPAKIEEMMRSPLSGDWRLRDGHLELCAALAVNVPGFPVRRPTPKVGFSPAQGNRQLSLVAAGVVERAPETVDGHDTIGLPSGRTIKRDDFEALVAAAIETVERHQSPIPKNEAEALAMARARLRFRSA